MRAFFAILFSLLLSGLWLVGLVASLWHPARGPWRRYATAAFALLLSSRLLTTAYVANGVLDERFTWAWIGNEDGFNRYRRADRGCDDSLDFVHCHVVPLLRNPVDKPRTGDAIGRRGIGEHIAARSRPQGNDGGVFRAGDFNEST